MKVQSAELQRWVDDLTVEHADYYGLKVAALVFASWIVVGLILWAAGVFQ
jgi:hypothetical protein